MKFSPKLSREFFDLLADQGAHPPRDVVGALLSFGEPDALLTYRVGGSEANGDRPGWLCVARAAGGLVIVEASSTDDDWTWDDRDFRRERDEKVAATWFPLGAISGMGLRNARAFHGHVVSDIDDVNVEGDWYIHVEGREAPLSFNRAPNNRGMQVVEQFCVELARAAAESR